MKLSERNELSDKIDDYYTAVANKNWAGVDAIGAQMWELIEKALDDKRYADKISPAIIYLISKTNEHAESSPTWYLPRGKKHGQDCCNGALRIVKLLSLQHALPEIKKMKEIYNRRSPRSSQDLMNEVLSDLGLEDEVAEDVAQRKQRSDCPFTYVYKSLAEVLSELEKYYLPHVKKQSEDVIKKDERYSSFARMPSHWHSFEGLLDDAFEHFSIHLKERYPIRTNDPGAVWCYQLDSDGKGLLSIMALSRSLGYNHFIWRTLEDKYILMLCGPRYEANTSKLKCLFERTFTEWASAGAEFEQTVAEWQQSGTVHLGTQSELERLCETIPIVSHQRAVAFFDEARRLTASDGQPVERSVRNVFSAIMGGLDPNFKVSCHYSPEATDRVANGIFMLESFHSPQLWTLFCAARVSNSSFLTRAYVFTGKENIVFKQLRELRRE
jgi:hypothetical protein